MDTLPPRVAAVGSAFPPNYYDQEELLEAARREWAEVLFNTDRLEQIHRSVLVGGRHLALPVERYSSLGSFGEANDAWIQVGQEVGANAIRTALEACELDEGDVDALFTVSVTGISTPSLDARLANVLGLPSDVTRVPIFGLGCVGGAAGLARAADYLRAFPDRVAVLLSVELCSLTLQREDLSVANLISSGLFGDGAAAAVLVGNRRGATGPEVVATRSALYPNTEHVMGWEISERGFAVVLSPEVPDMVRRHLRSEVENLLGEQGLSLQQVDTWVAHTGGPRVLDAVAEALDLPEDALELSWNSLREVGNLSSASVLMVLEETMRTRAPEPGSWGVLFAMGPGFCSEIVLLRW